MAKKLWPCMVCEKRYAELEQAEACEQRHDLRPGPDDDPRIQEAKAADRLWAALRASAPKGGA